MQKLNKVLLFLLPVVVFFTNFPVIKLGETEAMHLELSLPEIWLVLFALTSLPNLKKLARFVSIKKLAIISLFPLYATLSIIWSSNRLRALLTAGLLWLIIFAIMNILYLLLSPGATAKNVATAKAAKTVKAAAKTQVVLRYRLLQVFLAASFVVSIFCWLQCLLDLLGVARADSLMCAGCTYASFGFPHPNGFAIEPQFMGGLLIAPALASFYLAFARTKSGPICQDRTHRRAYLTLAVFFSATLFLTFSRGAIYAFLVAILCLVFALIFASRKDGQSKAPLLIFPAVAGAFLITLTAQGLMAAVSPTLDNFISGTTKALHHLTLGHLDLRPIENVVEPAPIESPQSTYDGYVSESTDIRVNFTNLALAAATKNPAAFIFGSGLGSAGTVLNREFPEKVGSPKEIVQNEYASLLLELGLVGIGLALFAIAVCITAESRRTKPSGTDNVSLAAASVAPNICVVAIVIGYALTLFFFSGLPNAFHIYLIPPLIFGIFASPGDLAHISRSALSGSRKSLS